MRGALVLRDLKEACFEHFSCRKKYILWLVFIFVVGLITGIITISQLTKSFSVSEVTDLLLLKSFKGQASVFGFLFKRVIDFLLVGTIVFVAGLWFYTSFAIIPVVFFRGYQVGVNVTIFCVLYGIGGVLNVILIYLPIQLLLHFIFINYCSVCGHNAWQRHKRGKGARFEFTSLVVFGVLLFVCCFIESLAMPMLLRKIILSV